MISVLSEFRDSMEAPGRYRVLSWAGSGKVSTAINFNGLLTVPLYISFYSIFMVDAISMSCFSLCISGTHRINVMFCADYGCCC